MNIALILAGGSGSRTEQSVPKQFISIYEKPIILYTLEAFEKHPDIDAIIVSCISGWQDVLKGYAVADRITKLRWVVEGGDNGQSSARNALITLENVCDENDIVVIAAGTGSGLPPPCKQLRICAYLFIELSETYFFRYKAPGFRELFCVS